ncbi:MAG: hypothetical protein ACRC2H_10740, partial [Silanimonas sp.]
MLFEGRMQAPAAPHHRKILTLAVLIVALGLAFMLAAGPVAAARALRVGIERIDAGALRAEAVKVRLATGEAGSDPLSLRIEAGRIDLPAAAVTLERVDWACERLLTLEPLVCEGALRVAGRPAGTLAVDVSTARTALRWSQGRRSIAVDKDLASPWRVAAQRLPIAWMDAFLKQLWAEGRVSDGTVSGT